MSDMLSLGQTLQWLARARLVDPSGCSHDTRFCRVHTDSRSLAPGDLFVALRGERFDGNDFLLEAKARGAVAAVCQGDAESRLQAAGLAGLIVADTRLALAELATRWRAQFTLPLVAVTGSNGKTTVTQMIAAIFRAFRPDAFLATQGNFNNDIGVPLTVLRLRAGHQLAVVELGMNHPGEIATLAAIAQPSVALVNNAQREHLEFMSSVAAVAQENGAVIDALAAAGVAVFPSDDAFSAVWQAKAGLRTTLQFGLADAAVADVRCSAAQWSGQAWQVSAQTPLGPVQYSLPVAGWHNVKNSLAALSCALAAAVPLSAIAQGLSTFEAVKGRSRAQLLSVAGRRITLVDDSYNANPDSVSAAIEMLASLPAPRLLVLGDMGEVGDQGPKFHAQAGAHARRRGIDALFALGELSQAAARAFGEGNHFGDMAALQQAVQARLGGFASVLVKGSRFMRMECVVASITACESSNEGKEYAV